MIQTSQCKCLLIPMNQTMPIFCHPSCSTLWLIIYTTLAYLSYLVLADSKVECLINAKIGFSDPKNVYQCSVPLKCCFEYSKPSCCGSKPFLQIVKEQFALWGGLFAILLTLASIVYCRKNDVSFPACVVFKNCLIQCCCGSSPNQNKSETTSLKVTANHTVHNIPNGDSCKSAKHGWRNNSVNPMIESASIQMSKV